MNDLIKWSVKFVGYGVFWVFVLSTQYNGQPFFYHAHKVLVENEIVQSLDAELAELWDRVYKTAKVTFAEKTEKDQKF